MNSQELFDMLDNGQFPIYIKILPKFEKICEETIDAFFIIKVLSHEPFLYKGMRKEDRHSAVHFVITEELYEYNKMYAKEDWYKYDSWGKRAGYQNYFDALFPNHNFEKDGVIKDKFYMGNYEEDWYEILTQEQVDGLTKKSVAPFLIFLEREYPQFFGVLWSEFQKQFDKNN